ncbi:hypothetical protein GCM10009761_01530 [Agromyces terreus]
MRALPFSEREAVASETPASRATSCRVAGAVRRVGASPSIIDVLLLAGSAGRSFGGGAVASRWRAGRVPVGRVPPATGASLYRAAFSAGVLPCAVFLIDL